MSGNGKKKKKKKKKTRRSVTGFTQEKAGMETLTRSAPVLKFVTSKSF